VVYREYKQLRNCTGGHRAFAHTLTNYCTKLIMEPVWSYELLTRLNDIIIHSG
jgi:hypothetical protein